MLPFRMFGIAVPLGDALVLIPPLLVVVALPITPQGFGSREVFAIQLFASYAAGEAAQRNATIAAATLSLLTVMVDLVQIPLSLFFVRREVAERGRNLIASRSRTDGHRAVSRRALNLPELARRV